MLVILHQIVMVRNVKQGAFWQTLILVILSPIVQNLMKFSADVT